MFKFLIEFQRKLITGWYAESAERAGVKVVNIFVQYLLAAAIFANHLFGNDFDRSVRTLAGTGIADVAAMMVVFVVDQHQLTLEVAEHLELLPVLGVLLGDDRARPNEISSGHLHAVHQRGYAFVYLAKVSANFPDGFQKCHCIRIIKDIRIRFIRLIGNKYFHSSASSWSIRRRGNVHLNHIIR